MSAKGTKGRRSIFSVRGIKGGTPDPGKGFPVSRLPSLLADNLSSALSYSAVSSFIDVELHLGVSYLGEPEALELDVKDP